MSYFEIDQRTNVAESVKKLGVAPGPVVIVDDDKEQLDLMKDCFERFKEPQSVPLL